MFTELFLLIEDYIDWLESAYIPLRYSAYNALGISILDLCGSLVVCYGYRNSLKNSKSWFEIFIACLLMQFGGTTLTGSLLLGQTPSWIMSFTAFPAFFLAYWLTFHCPFDLYWKYFVRYSSKVCPIHFIHLVQFGAAISSGHAITSWGVDKALNNSFHVNHARIGQSTLTCVLAGLFSGSGGGILADIFGMSAVAIPSFVMTRTSEFFSMHNYAVSATATRAFLLAILYYLLVTPNFMPWNVTYKNGFMSKKDGHAVIVLCQIFHLFLKSILDIDIFVFAYNLILTCMHISPVVHFSSKESIHEHVTISSPKLHTTTVNENNRHRNVNDDNDMKSPVTPGRSRSKSRKVSVKHSKTLKSPTTAQKMD